jgi:hypothetical protein
MAKDAQKGERCLLVRYLLCVISEVQNTTTTTATTTINIKLKYRTLQGQNIIVFQFTDYTENRAYRYFC